jgi:hypothetical protein
VGRGEEISSIFPVPKLKELVASQRNDTGYKRNALPPNQLYLNDRSLTIILLMRWKTRLLWTRLTAVSTNIREENIPLTQLKHILVDQGFQFILDSPTQR